MKKEVEKFVGAKHKKEEQGLGHSLRNLLCALTSKINSLFLEVKYLTMSTSRKRGVFLEVKYNQMKKGGASL